MRSLATATAVAILAVACGGVGDAARRADPQADAPAGEVVATASATGEASPVREPIVTTDEGCDGDSFFFWQEGCEPARSIEYDELLPGGPPPDGIESIDDPRFVDVEEAASWLDDASPVMVVEVGGDVRIYPLGILTWHEIVNDVVGGVPLVVTYCPLCNSALAFERTVEVGGEEEVLEFGTTGQLHRSNLVMYDRQHHNMWIQFDGEAVVGERFLGRRLERVPAWLLGFADAVELHGDAPVLSRTTGFIRSYGHNPYIGYDEVDREPFLFDGELDERYPPMTRVVGISHAGGAVTVLADELAGAGVVEVTVGGEELVVLWAPGQASALEGGGVDDGRDVGQTAVFRNELSGAALALSPDGDGRFVDEASGSTFDLRGRTVDGPHAGRALDVVPHEDTFWFTWAAFHPQTRIHGAATAPR